MNPSAQFSRHAYERVIERLTMEPDEVGELLDWNLAVKIGEEKGTRRIHRLFYSHEDFQCFVAIQDEKTKTVVTILPVDYYETLACKIPVPSLEEAQRLVSCEAASAKPVAPAPKVERASTPQAPSMFKISGTVMNMQRRPRTFGLGSWPVAEYGGSLARLLQDARFFQEMHKKIKLKKLPDEHAVGLVIRLGKNGDDVWVNIEDERDG